MGPPSDPAEDPSCTACGSAVPESVAAEYAAVCDEVAAALDEEGGEEVPLGAPQQCIKWGGVGHQLADFDGFF